MDDTISPPGSRDLSLLATGLDRPALHLVRARDSGTARLGGRPSGGPGLAWPRKDGRPLAFIAQVDCGKFEGWPSSGRLLFFYDADEQPWGFAPRDRGGWAVIHVQDANEPTPWPEDLSFRFPEAGMEAHPIRTWPTVENPAIEVLRLSDEEMDAWCAFRERAFGGHPQHQVGGYAGPVQNDQMELMCQLADGGVDCGEDPEADHRFRSLAPGAKDWRLLLQIDTDDALRFMWGDCGRLYFWIREQDLTAGSFDRAWVILQCG